MAGQLCPAFFVMGDLLFKRIMIALLADAYEKKRAKDIARLKAWNDAHPEAWKERGERYKKRHPERIKQSQARYNATSKAKVRTRRFCSIHKETLKERRKIYESSNREHVSKLRRLARQKNPELTKQKRRQQWVMHGHKHVEKHKAYVASNWPIIRAKQLANHHKRYRSDPIYKLACLTRGRIKSCVKAQRFNKRVQEILGCSFQDFKAHIESKFTSGMTWGKVMSGEIHIDHIKPVVSFDLKDESQFLQAFSWKNTQPLWALDNRTKGDRLDFVVTT